MVRQAIFWPVFGNFTNNVIRVVESSWNGKPVTCALIAGPRATVSQATGRQWNEEEFCVDPATGFLQTYSIAPGIYDAYDYSNALQFHGHAIAAALRLVKNTNYGPARSPKLVQRDVFINVQFVPAQ